MVTQYTIEFKSTVFYIIWMRMGVNSIQYSLENNAGFVLTPTQCIKSSFSNITI